MELRPIINKKAPDNRLQHKNIRLIMGVIGFILGVWGTIKIIIWVYN